MRFCLMIFAVIATPALAIDVPPDPPTFQQPTFDRPLSPNPPPPPPPSPPSPEDQEDPETPRVTTPPPKSAMLSCPKVKCVTDQNGHRRAMFTTDVDAEMYKLGRHFCAKSPVDVEVTACCLSVSSNSFQVLYTERVSMAAHKKAKAFCNCALGLD